MVFLPYEWIWYLAKHFQNNKVNFQPSWSCDYTFVYAFSGMSSEAKDRKHDTHVVKSSN